MEYGTLKDALANWDAGKQVWTIEMGGLGAGYENAIQMGVFELAKRVSGDPHGTKDENDALWARLDGELRSIMVALRPSPLDGLSGAQAGAIKNLAYHFVVEGYNETMHQVAEDRRIQVERPERVAA